MLTPHFNSADEGGWWAGDYGERICEWTYDPSAREIRVKIPGKIHGKARTLPSNPTDKNHLARIAIELAEQITGEKYDV